MKKIDSSGELWRACLAGLEWQHELNENGKFSIIYGSEIINSEIHELIQPISSIGEVPIIDSISFLPLE